MALCQGIGPSAIFGEISEMAVYAIKRFAFRPLAHIAAEIAKSFPSLTNVDAFRAIGIEFLVFWVAATPHHCVPRIIFARSAHPMLDVCFTHCRDLNFASKTPTRKSIASLQDIATYFGGFAAIANAFPTRRLANVFGTSSYEEPSKSLSGQSKRWDHKSSNTLIWE
jgi:hypothetical protein